MTDFHIDGVSSATPIAALKAGEAVDIAAEFLGFAPSVIGGSALALLIGGIFLCITGGITFEIPLSFIVVFTAFMGLFGGNGFDPVYLFAQICGGGILMGAFFMATDPGGHESGDPKRTASLRWYRRTALRTVPDTWLFCRFCQLRYHHI